MAHPYRKTTPLNKIDLKKRGRVLHENFSLNKTTVNDNDFEDKKINDPRGVLNRPMTNKEFNKGYRVRREKDGSVTIRGKRG
jgi:hypothetical protein